MEVDEEYVKFKDVKDKNDWWYWSYTELIALTYNYDQDFSSSSTFCDTNSIIIGTPRIRIYGVAPVDCDGAHHEIATNKTVTSILGIPYCYQDYIDNVQHLGDFQGRDNKQYEWDAHYLAVVRGTSSQYSYSKNEFFLPKKAFSAILYLITLNTANWLSSDLYSRAIITEFTLYHPPSELFSTVNFIAEFPATTGAQLSVTIESTHMQRYRTSWSYMSMLAEILLLPMSMYFMVKSALYLYHCRLRFWQSTLGILDVCLTILLWSYVICLMLRVQITEDLQWQLKVFYYQKYVNLKSAMTWDSVLDALLGIIIVVHVFRCISLLYFFKRFRRLLLIVAHASRDVLNISLVLFLLILVFLNLGFKWLNAMTYNFHSAFQSFISIVSLLFSMNSSIVPIEDLPNATRIFVSLYYVIMILILVMLFRGLYFAAFSFATKSFIYDTNAVEISLSDVFSGIVNHFANLITIFKRKQSKDGPSSATIATSPTFDAELESQMSSVMKKLDNVCNSMNEVHNTDDHLSNSDSSYAAASPISDHSRERSSTIDMDLLRHIVKSTNSNRTRLSGYDNSSYSDHADGFTEVPSCNTEVILARHLSDGVRLMPQSLSVSSRSNKSHMKVYDKNAAHFTKFLNDVHAASDENISGNQFSKYGKRIVKIKRRIGTSSVSKERKTFDNTVAQGKCGSSIFFIDEQLRNTETLGRRNDSNDFWELDHLDLSDE